MSTSLALSTQEYEDVVVDDGEEEDGSDTEGMGFGTVIRFQRRPTDRGIEWETSEQEAPKYPDVLRRRTSSAFNRSTGLVLSTTYLTATYGGAPAFYSLWLGEKCTSTVVVHLQLLTDSHRSVKLSSDRITFSPENYNDPQIVRVEMTDSCSHTNMIVHRVFSLDTKYDRIHTPNVVVEAEWSGIRSLMTIGGTKTKGGPIESTSVWTSSELAQAITPSKIIDPSTRVVVNHIASGDGFTVIAAKQQSEHVLAWGANQNGELGIGSDSPQPEPHIVHLRSFHPSNGGEHFGIVSLACGQHHVAVVTTHGRLFTWGSNKYGQLGYGEYSAHCSVPREVVLTPAMTAVLVHTNQRALRISHQLISGPTTANVTQVACGAHHTLVVTHQQHVLACGYNQAGQLGLGHCMQQHKGWKSATLAMITTLKDHSILGIAGGQNHSACVTSNGQVYVWGCSEDGRLGITTKEYQVYPTPMVVLKEWGIRARTIRCGGRHTAIISDRDLLYIWGGNEFGQLGCGDTRIRTIPWLVHNPTCLSTEGIVDVALGEFHSVCLTQKGNVYAWGLDLDRVGTKPRWSPERMDVDRAAHVTCGLSHTTIVTPLSTETTLRDETHLTQRRELHQIQWRSQEVAQWMERKEEVEKTKEKKKKTSISSVEMVVMVRKEKEVVIKKKEKKEKKKKKKEMSLETLPIKGVFYHSELLQPTPIVPSIQSPIKTIGEPYRAIPPCLPMRPTTASPRSVLKKKTMEESHSPRQVVRTKNSVVETLLHTPTFNLTTRLVQKKSTT